MNPEKNSSVYNFINRSDACPVLFLRGSSPKYRFCCFRRFANYNHPCVPIVLLWLGSFTIKKVAVIFRSLNTKVFLINFAGKIKKIGIKKVRKSSQIQCIIVLLQDNDLVFFRGKTEDFQISIRI